MRSFIILILFTLLALLAAFSISQYSPSIILVGVLSLAIFTVSFIKFEYGLYILIFSMLLSPEINVGQTQGASLGRGLTLRFEDFLMLIIGFSWFAKNAVYKELGLFLRTPLNKAILFYVLACLVSTGFGIMTGRVGVKTGTLFVLKYIEYFIIFFMMVNHVKNTDQIKRFVFCLFLTCFIVSIIGICQIPGGGRVSAPFEGEIGEPNTFGGYLLFIGAVATGLLMLVEEKRYKQKLAIFIICMIPSFLFTQSRTSYFALVPVVFVFGILARRKVIFLGLIAASLLVSPLFLPTVVKERIMFTFKQPVESGQITIGDIRLDTSTSARVTSWKDALQAWLEHPVLGYGVTGYRFIDAQYPRVLVETGILGLMAFFYLLFMIFRLAFYNVRELKSPYFKGLSIGFLAGYIGLLVHALGANTFIIVRIMEPFWFFAGIITVLPTLEQQSVIQVETVDIQRPKFVPSS
jgi:O-antigen ligase